ncbi:MAG: hypothetical protein ACRDRL_19330, partial [Sciscionella sp.]
MRWQSWQTSSKFSSLSRSIPDAAALARGDALPLVAPMLWANSAAATECKKVRESPRSRRLQTVQRPALRPQSASLTLSLILP